MMKMIEKYGAEIIDQVIDQFYFCVQQNNNLQDFFKTQDVDSLKRHQKQLFRAIINEPLEYNGRELYEVHRILNFAPALYDDVRKCLVESMKLCGISSEDTDYILSNITSPQGLEKMVNAIHSKAGDFNQSWL